MCGTDENLETDPIKPCSQAYNDDRGLKSAL